MTKSFRDRRLGRGWFGAALAAVILGSVQGAGPGHAETAAGSAFARALAEAVSGDEAAAAFYKASGYADLWTGADDAVRRQAALFDVTLTAEEWLQHLTQECRNKAGGVKQPIGFVHSP